MKTTKKILAQIEQNKEVIEVYEKAMLERQELLKQAIERSPDNPYTAVDWIRHNGEELEDTRKKIEQLYEENRMLNYFLR